MKKIVAVIATQCKSLEEFEKRPVYASLQRQFVLNNEVSDNWNENNFDFIIIKDNKEGLSKLYNKFLYDSKYKNDILLFVHDDVELEDLFLIDKLKNSPYIVTGLAGAKTADLSRPPAWHLMSDRENFVGEVTHAKDKQVWTTVFGPTNSRALTIDGLFIAINVEKALDKQVKFDEDFNFHHYDIAFCLDCNKKKTSVGVLPIRVVHHGLGDSMLTQEWKESAAKFSAKYKN